MPESPTWLDVVVPYAGSAALLRETVTSVLAQVGDGWRLTVVEDGPQDPAVGPWLTGLDDPRVRYLLNPATLGVAANFQRCFGLATAPYVMLLGCDDRLHPTFTEVVRRALDAAPGVEVVQPGVQVVDSEGRPWLPLGDRIKRRLAARAAGPEQVVLSGETLLTSLMHGNWAYFPSLCWHRETAVRHGLRQDLHTVLDLDLLARVLLDGGRFLWVPEVVFDYRRHAASASSLTAIRSDRFDEEREVMDAVAERAAALGWRSTARAARLRATSRLHAGLLTPTIVRRGDRTAARRALRHALGR